MLVTSDNDDDGVVQSQVNI